VDVAAECGIAHCARVGLGRIEPLLFPTTADLASSS